MISRELQSKVVERLRQFDSVAVLGPRQVGKTTLARLIADSTPGARYLDLQNPADLALLDDPAAWFSMNQDRLIVLDEIHKAPELFPVLRSQIDQRRRLGLKTGGFLILGSASIDLLRQSSESLAGRISFIELFPLSAREYLAAEGKPDHLWLHGGYPEAVLAPDDGQSMQWRQDFIRTFIERDVPQFGHNAPAERIDRLLRMLSIDQGELLNSTRLARSLGTSIPTVNRDLELLNKLFLVRLLPAWHQNSGKRLVKSPRPFIRDSGLLHSLLRIRTRDELLAHPVAGRSWEGFVIENLLAAAGDRVQPFFYRTAAGAEADLALEFAPGLNWVIEIKLSSAPAIERGFFNAADDIRASRRIVVYRGKERFPMRGGIEAMGLVDAMNEVTAATL